MKKAWILVLTLALLPIFAIAGGRSEARKQLESSMLLSGVVVIDASGNVTSSEIDQAKTLPPAFVDFVQKHVASWEFEPVMRAGRAVSARSKMSLRLVAKKVNKDDFSLVIRSANFTGEPPNKEEVLSSKTLTPPRYPVNLARRGVHGTVYLVVKVGPGGQVEDAFVEQVNLRTIGVDKEMTAWRGVLSDAALQAARQWVFIPPVKGEQADDGSWSARVPVAFLLDNNQPATYGEWHAYIPGPRQRIPWSDEEQSGFSPDSLADGGVYMLGQGNAPKLLTKLGDGT